MVLVKRTRAYLRSAEFGFFGVIVPTRVHTPRFWGEGKSVCSFSKLLYPFCSAGAVDFSAIALRPLRTSWLIVGILAPPSNLQVSKGFKPTEPGGSSIFTRKA